MSVLPSRLLVATMSTSEATDNWTIDDGTGDLWVNYPYRWSCSFDVSVQFHGSHLTKTVQQYDATDIVVGDWFADFATGTTVRVVEVLSSTPTTVEVIMEDVDRFNAFNDPTQQGSGIGQGYGAFFSLGDDGLPILFPMTAVAASLGANLAWQLDQISRFRYRNYLRSHYPVHQSGHDFTVGELLVLGTDGYERAHADGFVDSIVGSVSAVGIPGPEWFNYRPVGRVVENLDPSLPGNPGDLVYITPTGTFTTKKPTAWARPVYIRLETPTKGIVLDRGVDGVSKNGYSSQTYVVPSIIERDALTGINVGDQCMIKNSGNGEWNHYIYEDSDTWTLLGTEDSSNVDSASKTITITHQSDPTGLIATISTGRRVDEVIVEVKEAFDGTASLTIGTDMNRTFLMDVDQSDLALADAYHTTPSCVLKNDGMDTRVKYWLSTSGSTQGRAILTVTYS